MRFLHGMVTNDVESLRPGQGCHAAMLSVKGKTLADLVIYADPDELFLELDGSLGEKVKTTFDRHLIMDDVEVVDVSATGPEVALYGEDAQAEIESKLGTPLPPLLPYHHVTIGGVRVASAPELGLPGYHIFGELPVTGQVLDDAAFEVRRIEAGHPRYGVDLDEERLILEAGMDDAISHTKGCYLGQEVVARATSRGHINRKLVGLILSGSEPAEPGARLSSADRPEAGTVTSSVVSQKLGRPIALGYVHRTLWDPGTRLTLHETRGDRLAEVVSLPF